MGGEAQQLGSEGEALAQAYLESQGWIILTKNFRYHRSEIDIIGRDGEVLVFCEVKMRETDQFGPPEYAVTPRKQKTIKRVAAGYLLVTGLRDQACRFDVIAIRKEGSRPVLNHIRNAF